MSGHETIRVLEVEVDASSASSAADGKSECKTDEGVAEAGEQPDASSTQDRPTVPQSTGGGVGKSLSSLIMLDSRELTSHISRLVVNS